MLLEISEGPPPDYTSGNPNQTFNDTPAEKKVPALEEPGEIKESREQLERRLGEAGGCFERIPHRTSPRSHSVMSSLFW